MKTRTKYRSRPLLAAALATAVLGVSWAAPAPEVGDVVGGWNPYAAAGCAGCIGVGAAGLMGGGMGWLLWALWTPMGSAAVTGCALTCAVAVT